MHRITRPLGSDDESNGILVSEDGTQAVVSHLNSLAIYSLPGFELHKRCNWTGMLQYPRKLCVVPGTDRFVVADCDGRRIIVAELPDGYLERTIGHREIQSRISGIAATGELVAVGKSGLGPGPVDVNNRILLFNFASGALVRSFAGYGEAPGLVRNCEAMRFSRDGALVYVTEGDSGDSRLSVFTTAGEFVKCIGEGQLTSVTDFELLEDGGIALLMCPGDNDRQCVTVVGEDGAVRQQFGHKHGAAKRGLFADPSSLAVHGHKMYVLDQEKGRVHVFE